MTFARLDDGFTGHPKVLALGSAQRRWTWLEVIVYTCRYDNPVLPASLVDIIPRATESFLRDCESIGLVDRDDDGKRSVHDWNIYNGSIDDRVAHYLSEHPNSSANEVQNAIRGKRELVLSAVKRLRPVVPGYREAGTAGTSLVVPEVVPTAPAPAVSTEPRTFTKPALSPETQDVYDHWRAACSKTRSNYDRISPQRRRKIEARLKEFSTADLKQAITNASRDVWEDRALHNDIVILLRSQEQVDYFLEMPQATNGNGNHGAESPEAFRARIAAIDAQWRTTA